MYSLHKSRHVLKGCYKWYRKKKGSLTADQAMEVLTKMEKLDDAIVLQNRSESDRLAHDLEAFAKTHFRKSIFEYMMEVGFALIFALIIATIVRQMWFEFYEIPSGSMRPTFRETDHLTVTKTAFGLNIPLTTGHFYFDPNLVQRTSVVIWTGENIPGADEYTTFLKVFPYKKRYIKRMIGKPGDSIYFYGGKIYAVDKDGNPQMDFIQAKWMDHLDYLPFMFLDGNIRKNNIEYSLIKEPLGRYNISQGIGTVFDGKEWVKDDPEAYDKPHDKIKTFSDIWGIGNFAMAKLLRPEEVSESTRQSLGEAKLYLQLHHTPHLPHPSDLLYHLDSRTSISFDTSIIPLDQKHLDTLMENMYTEQFSVKNGKFRGYPFRDVPDDTYEFYFGKGSKIGWGGILWELPSDNPLMSHDPENVLRLFNVCMGLHQSIDKEKREITLNPHRYAYYRDGDLYVMGGPLLKKGDPLLAKLTFKDRGAPLKADGTFDVPFIQAFGVKVPEKHYLVLGDNHAISADSRVFGFVPEANLQGAPSLILWPPGDRLGFPKQKPYPIFNTPRSIVWAIAIGTYLIWFFIQRRNLRRHLLK